MVLVGVAEVTYSDLNPAESSPFDAVIVDEESERGAFSNFCLAPSDERMVIIVDGLNASRRIGPVIRTIGGGHKSRFSLPYDF